MAFSINVTRAISIAVVWGALLANHWRRRRQGDDGSGQAALQLESSSDSLSLHTAFEDVKANDAIQPSLNPLPQETQVLDLTVMPVENSLLRRVLSFVGSFVSPSSAQEQATVAEVDRSFAESMGLTKAIASSLNLPAHLPESFYAKLPFLRSGSNNPLKPMMEELELLNFYSKFSPFLKAILPLGVSLELLQCTVNKLENLAIYLLASCYEVDALEVVNSDLELLMFLDVPADRDLTPFPHLRRKDHLINFGDCQFQFASFLANLSIVVGALDTLNHPCLRRWFNLWSISQDIRLQLLAAKINHNLATHIWCLNVNGTELVDDNDHPPSQSSKDLESKFFLPSSPTSKESLSRPVTTSRFIPAIYGPDIFRLDTRDEIGSPPAEVDIIFVNGMLGSVYHTWRQRDSSCATEGGEQDWQQESSQSSHGETLKNPLSFPAQVNCWPRVWLGDDFPQARILGVNANLRPFVWNPICPAEKIKRRIDQRALDILQQLLVAGVGRRPIIWITHSAGGILTKEILKLSATWFAASTTSSVENNGRDRELTASGSLYNAAHGLSGSAAANITGIAPMLSSDGDLGGFIGDFACMERPSSLASQTKGIVFLSVPHRGNQSMMFLYQFPMIFTLTPEAKQLQQNNASIIDLHAWFVSWASKHPLRVLNMIENRDTTLNRWYSVRLVQHDPKDDEFCETVLVDTDHSDICKPTNNQDEVYTKIVDFIHSLLHGTS